MEQPQGFKKWYILFRVWSLTAAAIPVLLGTVWAAYQGYFHPLLFAVTLIGGLALQVGTNLINTYYDFTTGVDTVDTAKSCPYLVEGRLSPEYVKRLGLYTFAFVALLGIYLVYLRGWPILLLGLLAIWAGYGYTGGVAYKFQGLGSIAVFFLMGPLMVLATYYVQTGFFAWSPVLVSLPVGFLVSAILNANDLRDLKHDREAGIKTLPIIIGYRPGFVVQFILYLGAFISIALLVLTNYIPPVTLLPLLLVLPGGVKILKQARLAWAGNISLEQSLEQKSAQFHCQFGLFFVAGLFLGVMT